MIPRDDIILGILSSPPAALLLEIEEAKPMQRARPLFDFFSELGALQKKGDKYKRGRLEINLGEHSPISDAVSELFQHVAFPYLISGRRVGRLTPDLQRALYTYTSAYQALRIALTQDLLRYGGLTLVAGWFPCAFSSELMSIAGRDVVILEEREDIVALEMDRLSLIPLAPAPLGQELAAASFYAFEIAPLSNLDEVAEKYGKFNTAVVCGRGADLDKLGKVAEEVYYIATRDRPIALLNNALLNGLGLAAPSEELEKTLRKAQRQELGPFDVYILRGTGPT
ncbi:hypothetical protein [Pyrobaculum ferrireducens]|uniref:Uncharacterized protein n=1 Tax=Pyrobaculum ferrireducens TaxID=1104324 RepID=G7VHS7_9CREN|nr:hypothetical protein [Pyrobaculum ferrireducens]AET32099.1 hypothetical protein P186_0648 [Pyrobaculum ferrireducens]